MKNIDFDDYVDNYQTLLRDQLSFFEKDEDYFAWYKVGVVHKQCLKQPLRILEYGCGTGKNIKYLIKLFSKSAIFGCDISEKSLEVASEQNKDAHFFSVKAERVDKFGSFDLVFVANVFHHIAPKFRKMQMTMLKNCLSRNGEIFIFEHNLYNPITRYLVSTCPFDEDAILLKSEELKFLLVTSGFDIISKKYILFFPSFLKKLRALEKYMGMIPMGGQYYVHARKNCNT